MFNYDTVPVDGASSIRLLRLHPKSYSQSAIHCDLFCTELSHDLKFTALSYTWGDALKLESVTIKVNGQPLAITKSLSEALEELRLEEGEARLLWIDQICINQNSNLDRETQVPLMRDIYSIASETVSWLGLATQGSQAAMDYLANASHEGTAMNMVDLNVITETITLSPSKDDRSLRLHQSLKKITATWGEWQDMAILTDIIAFFTSPYFTRGWIKQEIAIPAHLVIRCGSKTLTIEEFKVGFIIFRAHYHYSEQKFREAAMSMKPSEMLEMGHNFLLDDDSSGIVHPTLKTRDVYQSGGYRDQITLDKLLRRFGPKVEFTNPRDQVYGFLGLASDVDELGLRTMVDYSRPWEQIHTLAVRRMIQKGAIHLLEHVQYPKASNELPSWVPNLSSKWYAPLWEVTIGSEEPFAAGGKEDITPSENLGVDWEDKTLIVCGRIVDPISQVGTGWDHSGDTPGRQSPVGVMAPCREIESFCEESAKLQASYHGFQIYKSADRMAEAVWRIPILDHEFSGTNTKSHRATWSSKLGYEDVKDKLARAYNTHLGLPGEEPAPSQPFQFSETGQRYYNSMNGLEQRRPFLTKRGIVGIGPLDVKVGDVVCVLAGGQVPLILRSCPGPNLVEQAYSVVGEAYCDGIMDGEALAAPLEEISLV